MFCHIVAIGNDMGYRAIIRAPEGPNSEYCVSI